MAKTNARSAWRVTMICAVWGLVLADVHAQAVAPDGLIPYSNDAVSLNDGISVQVAMFNRSLDERLRLPAEQQARMVEIWQEEHATLAQALTPTASSTDVQRRALDKGVALDDHNLELMQQSLDRLLARLRAVLTDEQLQRFAEVEQQKLDAQGRFLHMKRWVRSVAGRLEKRHEQSIREHRAESRRLQGAGRDDHGALGPPRLQKLGRKVGCLDHARKARPVRPHN